MLDTTTLRDHFARARAYPDYLAAAKPTERDNFAAFHARVHLTSEQSTLIKSFTRRINVLCLSGSWCGDCVQQCPFLDHIARANPAAISLRFLERDAEPALAERLRICGGNRVPVTLFLNEDHDFVSLFGDRTLARYRAIAARQLGPSCPLPGAPVPADEIAATLQDFVNEFERVHLLVRLSAKLRQRHND